MVTDNEILQSIKWKKSVEYCALRLGMSEEMYIRRKQELLDSLNITAQEVRAGIESSLETNEYISQLEQSIVEINEDLERGMKTITAISSSEPKSAEEIETLLKIDKTKWQLSSYWNKQKTNYWLVSAMVTKIKPTPASIISSVLENVKLEYSPVSSDILINSNFTDNTCAVLSLQDIHVGKKTIKESNIQESVKACVESLILRSYHSSKLDKIIFVLGGDLVNMDTFLGTTTSGTPVENSMEAYEAYKLAFEIMFWSINYLKQFCNKLEVVYIPGNHSRLMESNIAYSLSRCITDKNITWDIEYAERKVSVYGNNMFCFEHGDYDTRKSPLVFASEFAEDWGKTKYRTLFTGHFHKKKKIEYITEDEINGFTFKILPSLCGTDMYHYSNKWTGSRRGGVIELYSREKGLTGSFSYYE